MTQEIQLLLLTMLVITLEIALGWLPIKALRLPYYFTMINFAALVGVFHFVTGRRAWR